MMTELSEKLQDTTGKITYGYLKPEVKKMVDDIVRELAGDKNIESLYKHWCDMQNEVLATYKSEFLEHPPLWEQKEFRSIKNAVIKEALDLNRQRDYIGGDRNDPEQTPDQDSDDHAPHQRTAPSYHGGTVMTATNLIRHLSKIIEDDYNRKNGKFIKADSKQMKRIMEKKSALGLKLE